VSAGERRLCGACLKVGDHVNTDIVIPARYLTSIDPTELAEHAFEPMGPEFQERLRRSQVIVAGRNFGCGSAREQAATCLLGVGVKAVVAVSFSRVFFRNAINTGLLVVECSEAVDAVQDGDELCVDVESGTVHAGARSFTFAPYPDSLRGIVDAGGLIPFLIESRVAGR